LPHGWLFNQVNAVVHHGGFGGNRDTPHPGPVVLGQRVAELGAGPRYIPRKDLNCASLTQAFLASMAIALVVPMIAVLSAVAGGTRLPIVRLFRV
jgi:hypothetical protein